MARHILRCIECGSYSMDEKCGCSGKAVSPKPPKYSPEDKYASYRRKIKKKELRERGLC